MIQKGKRALLIAPYHDAPTGTASTAARSLIDFLRGEGMDVTLLEGKDAVFEKFSAVLSEASFDLIAYFGHGSEDSWIGQQPFPTQPLLDIDNAYLLHGAVAVAISCDTLQRLGARAVTQKARAYLGFSDLVVAESVDRGYGRNYRADTIRTFMKPIVSLVLGRTVAATVKEFQDLCRAYATLYEKKNYDFAQYYEWAMLNNAYIFGYSGNPKTTL